MENWYNSLIELDIYDSLKKHNINDTANMSIIFPKKRRFSLYESLGDKEGETCFIRKKDFINYLKLNNYPLEVIDCEDFILEIKDTRQLKGINSLTWDNITIYDDSDYKCLCTHYKLRDGSRHNLMVLGENISVKNENYNKYEYSYVIFYIDDVLDMVTIFKSTYHEVGKKDLSFKSFKEEKIDTDLKSGKFSLEEAVKCEKIDTDYLFTKMSNSHLFNKLLDHPVFKFEVKNSPGLKSQFMRLHNEITPKKKWILGLNK